jgi:hypothetical protein
VPYALMSPVMQKSPDAVIENSPPPPPQGGTGTC